MSDYLTTVCPKCNHESADHPNSYYIHICESCGEQYNSAELIIAIKDKEVHHEIERLEKLLKEFPALSKLNSQKFEVTEP
jgi:ribosomal protein L37AE/L43A